MSLVKEEIIFDKECCRTVASVKQQFGEDRFLCHPLNESEMDMVCPYPNRTSNILEHIRECCGHEEFFQEIAILYGVSVDALLLVLDSYGEFVTYLAHVLTKEFKETKMYDKFFSCIPLIKESLALEHGPTKRALSVGPTIDLVVFQDLFACLLEIREFHRLLSRSMPRVELSLSDLEDNLARGVNLPETLVRLCTNFGKVKDTLVSRMELKEGYEALIEIDTWAKYDLAEYGGTDVLRCCKIFPKFRNTQGNRQQNKKVVLPNEMLFYLLDMDFYSRRELIEDYLPIVEIDSIFETACYQGFPVFIGGQKVQIVKHGRNKSARK